ncbi:MAG: fumarylacetoacetate hydrolase family protein [Deltaproteobacteria bacterium]|nr:fumarylacetoacetate hydrolase family protein [Deltaproteobacteria bacterium]
MKLGTFEIGGRKRLGAFEGDWAVDLSASYCAFLAAKGAPEPEARADAELPNEMVQFISQNEISLPAARKAIDFVREKNFQIPGCVYPLSQITFRASHRPPKIICTGVNYEDYRKLIGIQYSPVPLVFLKSPSCVIGHEETIFLPQGYGVFYHEWEFSCVIAQKCKMVPKEKVNAVIFGYTILNDITARSLEATNREFQPWGKNIDTFAPMGPWIVTPDAMPKDLYRLKTLRRRNGKLECASNTSNMRLGFGEIIEFVSNFWTLEPGDVVTTATPPAGPFEPGDVIEAEIEGIGVLRNSVIGVAVDRKYAELIQLKDLV